MLYTVDIVALVVYSVGLGRTFDSTRTETETRTMTTETLIDDEVEMTTCDNRGDEISLDRYDGHEGLCEGFVATTFICVECSNRTYTEDAQDALDDVRVVRKIPRMRRSLRSVSTPPRNPPKRRSTPSSTQTTSTSSRRPSRPQAAPTEVSRPFLTRRRRRR